MEDAEHKKREAYLRRKAANQGLALRRSRTRDEQAPDYGTYQLADAETGTIVKGIKGKARGFGLDLDEIEDYLLR